MTQQFTTETKGRIYEPVDPEWMYRERRLSKGLTYNELLPEYDWDDSYVL